MSEPTQTPIRIESRLKEAPAAAWRLMELAHTDEQAAMMIRTGEKTFPDFEFRAVPNTPDGETVADNYGGELAELRAFKQAVIDNTGTDDPHVMAKAFRIFEKVDQHLAKLEAREAAVAAREAELLPAPEPARLDPLPFKPGDFIRCVHSDAVARVTAVDDQGFDVVTADGQPYRCPRGCAPDYRTLSKKEVAPLLAALKDEEQKAIEASDTEAKRIDALAGESPEFPFGVGDTVRDIHTGALVVVTAVGADAILKGFDWAYNQGTAQASTGSVPLNAVGNFELQGERVSRRRK